MLVNSLKILPNANSIILLENSNSKRSSTLHAASSNGVKNHPPRSVLKGPSTKLMAIDTPGVN
ncbi:Uncharacterised protein [Vibrio cholerae]|nr:Uncharacterised protein [Vibrio cholerae]